VSRAHSPKLASYSTLAAVALIGALVLGRPELVALAVPFVLAIVVGLGLAREPAVALSAAPERDRAVEGEEIAFVVEAEAGDRAERGELLLLLPPGLEPAGEAGPVEVSLAAGERRSLSLPIRCRRFGGYRVGDLLVRARGPFALITYEAAPELARPLKVFPSEEVLRRLVAPLDTQVFAGSRVARAAGDGIEFADIRPFVPGDRVRRVNWRVSARRGSLYVNERHPERSTDVVLFVDTFAEARGEAGGTLDQAVRAAVALTDAYLAQRDRVGLVGFGGVLRWLVPEMGPIQRYRIVDALLDSEVVVSFAWKGIEVVPRRTFPPRALVVALTPLLDERSVIALLDLRGRGFDLAVVEVSPVPFLGPLHGTEADLARRLWLLRRETLRYRFQRRGVPVVEWREGTPLGGALEEVRAFRRAARHVRV
jgi:uncharacterized protein (DUF58 family)